jgi:hypothetical protein
MRNSIEYLDEGDKGSRSVINSEDHLEQWVSAQVSPWIQFFQQLLEWQVPAGVSS